MITLIKNQSFFTKSSVEVAKNLIGKLLIYNNKYLLITETEAYGNDKSCHGYNGKTKRNYSMFEEGGIIYVYFIYGMYYCLNIVTGVKDIPEAVLIRNCIYDEKHLYNQRLSTYQLINGPGKLCKFLNINLELNNKTVYDIDSTLSIASINYIDNKQLYISKNKRIGIKKDIDKEWRFTLNY